jgi:hypothetical protein
LCPTLVLAAAVALSLLCVALLLLRLVLLRKAELLLDCLLSLFDLLRVLLGFVFGIALELIELAHSALPPRLACAGQADRLPSAGRANTPAAAAT